MLGYLFIIAIVAFTALALGRWIQLYSQKSAADSNLHDALRQYGLQALSGFDSAQVIVGGAGVRGMSNAQFKLGSANAMDAPELLRSAQIECELPLTDVVVCKRSLAPAVFGAFVPAPVPTGAPAFDQVYGVFFAGSGGPPSQYAMHWLTPDVQQRMLTSNMAGLQAASGQVRFAIAAIPNQVTRPAFGLELAHAIALWAAIRRAATGAGPTPPAVIDAFPAVSQSNAADIVSLIGLWLSIIAAFLSGISPELLGLGDIVCPDGGSFHSGRGSHSNYCFIAAHNSYHATLWPKSLCWFAMAVILSSVMFAYVQRGVVAQSVKARRILVGE
jgi:hypothetical protein